MAFLFKKTANLGAVKTVSLFNDNKNAKDSKLLCEKLSIKESKLCQ
jgi:hypothetical protein